MSEPSLIDRYLYTREQSIRACQPLLPEDYCLQAAAFASPPKWHLAHTSWFFETFLLKAFVEDYRSPNEHYQHLFNSYYNGVGEQFSRPQRGLLSRPPLQEILAYRAHIDNAMTSLLDDSGHPQRQAILARTRLGIEHEQQHQELIFTDIKYSLSANPLAPAYTNHNETTQATPAHASEMQWREYQGGLTEIGIELADLDTGQFAFDNEGPAHKVYLTPFALADRLVTNAEYQAFIDDGGYQRPEFWLSDGWAMVQQEQWQQPLYWHEKDGELLQFTLYGTQARRPQQAVCHISGYEADAYACWAEARLPTEFEWEFAARAQDESAIDDESSNLQPSEARGSEALLQLYGDCWQWTGSAYRPYPGFKASPGAIGEYNGKFMANQWVLRGGSVASSGGHLRPSYRNFFYPQDRWQFSGLRLAKDI